MRSISSGRVWIWGSAMPASVRRRLTSGPERSVCWPLLQRSLMVRTAARTLIVKRFGT